jgi:tripartite-type tricarboxylate transporter receptor subunit TctC
MHRPVVRAGLDMVLVPYKGGVQAVADLVAGHVDMYFGNASEMLPHFAGGDMRLLAVATLKRLPQAPDLPAVAETLPGFQFGSWNGFMVPRGTPKEIIDWLVEVRSRRSTRHRCGKSLFAAASCPVARHPTRLPSGSKPTSRLLPKRWR